MCPSDDENADKRAARLKDFQYWIACFSELSAQAAEPLEWDDDAATYLNQCYWLIAEDVLRPKLEHKNGVPPTLDHHKIMSALEICIVHAETIRHTDPDIQRILNAQFAFFVAKTVMHAWTPQIQELPPLQPFDRAHMSWLIHLGEEGYPYFSNSATWYCYELYCLERLKNPGE